MGSYTPPTVRCVLWLLDHHLLISMQQILAVLGIKDAGAALDPVVSPRSSLAAGDGPGKGVRGYCRAFSSPTWDTHSFLFTPNPST